MIKNKKVVALIPARGGSKSIPRKNIKPFVGKPLIAWTIELALQSALIDDVYVSTEDEPIADVSKRYGAKWIPRPSKWAQDDALPIDVIRHAVSYWGQIKEHYDLLLYLEPTCPLRTEDDIKHCLTMLVDEPVRSVATFTEAALHPHRAWKIENERPKLFLPTANPWLPRQQLPPAYQLNGAIYAMEIDAVTLDNDTNNGVLFVPIGAVLMPPERSVDIDGPADWQWAEFLMNQRQQIQRQRNDKGAGR